MSCIWIRRISYMLHHTEHVKGMMRNANHITSDSICFQPHTRYLTCDRTQNSRSHRWVSLEAFHSHFPPVSPQLGSGRPVNQGKVLIRPGSYPRV